MDDNFGIEMRPCPFCGGKVISIIKDETPFSRLFGVDIYRVYCRSCGVKTHVAPSTEEAAFLWNKREIPADAPFLKHGCWITFAGEKKPGELNKYRCSECGALAPLAKTVFEDIPLLQMQADYCPHCGARMDITMDEYEQNK